MEDMNVVSPVFAAHCLTAGLPFETREGYGPFPLPAGELNVSLLYTHTQFYVDKMKKDLKMVGVWDTMSHTIVGSGAMQVFHVVARACVSTSCRCRISCLVLSRLLITRHACAGFKSSHVPWFSHQSCLCSIVARGHAPTSKELPEVHGVPEILPPQQDDRSAGNTRALLGFSTDMPWNPFRVPLLSRRVAYTGMFVPISSCKLVCAFCRLACEMLAFRPLFRFSPGAVAVPREVPVVHDRRDTECRLCRQHRADRPRRPRVLFLDAVSD